MKVFRLDGCRTRYLLALTCLTIFQINCLAIKLDDDGGYHITIGIRNEPQQDVENYLANVQTEVEDLSRLIHDTSNGIFYLKSISILLPSSWDYDYDGLATSQSFPDSDIKISDDYLIPDVIRPTQCSLPGEEIRLPTSYFKDDTDDLYKAKGKALLHLWAQFRWGVFEESGFPGNSRFPYFHKLSDASQWEVSACTNNPLQGSYEYPNQTTCTINDETKPPDSECRFRPDEIQTDVHSSLMTNFYWIDSITTFCTEETHTIMLHNRQNVFCGYKSVMNVFQECHDVGKVTQPGEYVEPSFIILRQSEKPLIYFLVDGRTMDQIPDGDITNIKNELKQLFDASNSVEMESLGTIAKFPGQNSIFEELIPWTGIGESLTEFETAMDDTISQTDSKEGLFGTAMKSIVEGIGLRQHSAGAFLFIFKTFPGTSLDAMWFERDIAVSLIKHNVKLFAVELSSSALDPGRNLQWLASQSGGSHVVLKSPVDISTTLPEFITTFIEETKNPSFGPDDFPTAIYKGKLSPEEEVSIKLLETSKKIELSLTTPVFINSVSLKVGSQELDIIKSNEWDEPFVQGRRVVHSAIHDSPTLGEILTVSFNCPTEVDEENCSGYLTVLQTRLSNEEETISVSVSTSAVESEFDGTSRSQLAVFAKLEQNEQPLVHMKELGNLDASATLCLQNNPSKCWFIDLTDNGAGYPDLIKDDGILSGAIVPDMDGSYNCFVTVSFEKLNFQQNSNISTTQQNLETRKARKSVDQNLFPCALTPSYEEKDCVGVEPTKSFQIVGDLSHQITVVNSNQIPPLAEPTQLFDLEIETYENNLLTFTWTAPTVFSPGIIEKAEMYDLRYCKDMDSILQDFENCIIITIGPTNNPGEPGESERLTLDIVDLEQDIVHYFGIRSSAGGQNSQISNVVWMTPKQQVTDPTQEPITNTTPTEDGETTPTEDEGTTPTEDEGTTPTEDEGTTPTEDPETTPTEDEGTTPTEDEGTTPTEDPETTPTEDEGTTPTEDEGTTPTEDDGTTPTEDEGTTPTEDPETTPTEDEGTTPTEDEGTTPTEDEGTTPTEDEGTTPTEDPETTPTEDTETSPTEDAVTTPTADPETTPTEDSETTPTGNPDTTPTEESEGTDEPTTEITDTTSDASTTSPTTSTIRLQTTEASEYFFKKPIGYITAGAIALVAVGGLGAAVGYLCWKRKQMMTVAQFANKIA